MHSFDSSQIQSVFIETVTAERATLDLAPEMKRRLTALLESGARNIVVDLRACAFIDSTFLGALVIGLKRASASGSDIRLVGFQPAVKTMLELTRLYRVFDCYDAIEDAVASFAVQIGDVAERV